MSWQCELCTYQNVASGMDQQMCAMCYSPRWLGTTTTSSSKRQKTKKHARRRRNNDNNNDNDCNNWINISSVSSKKKIRPKKNHRIREVTKNNNNHGEEYIDNIDDLVSSLPEEYKNAINVPYWFKYNRKDPFYYAVLVLSPKEVPLEVFRQWYVSYRSSLFSSSSSSSGKVIFVYYGCNETNIRSAFGVEALTKLIPFEKGLQQGFDRPHNGNNGGSLLAKRERGARLSRNEEILLNGINEAKLDVDIPHSARGGRFFFGNLYNNNFGNSVSTTQTNDDDDDDDDDDDNGDNGNKHAKDANGDNDGNNADSEDNYASGNFDDNGNNGNCGSVGTTVEDKLDLSNVPHHRNSPISPHNDVAVDDEMVAKYELCNHYSPSNNDTKEESERRKVNKNGVEYLEFPIQVKTSIFGRPEPVWWDIMDWNFITALTKDSPDSENGTCTVQFESKLGLGWKTKVECDVRWRRKNSDDDATAAAAFITTTYSTAVKADEYPPFDNIEVYFPDEFYGSLKSKIINWELVDKEKYVLREWWLQPPGQQQQQQHGGSSSNCGPCIVECISGHFKGRTYQTEFRQVERENRSRKKVQPLTLYRPQRPPYFHSCGGRMKSLEICAGIGRMSEALQMEGIETTTLDCDESKNVTSHLTLQEVEQRMKKGTLPDSLDQTFDNIWAAPECRTWSFASGNTYRNSQNLNGFPDKSTHKEVIEANRDIEALIEIIQFYQSRNPGLITTIENPEGYLQKHELSKRFTSTNCLSLNNIRLSYCNFRSTGSSSLPTPQKNTILWTNSKRITCMFANDAFACKMDCTGMARTGKTHQMQVYDFDDRGSAYPPEFCKHIAKLLVGDLRVHHRKSMYS